MVKLTERGLFSQAKKVIPGGVNSPVRSFKAVGGDPIFVNHAAGSRIYDEAGKEFIDYCLSWGALILGHAHPQVKEALKKAIDNGTNFGTATKKETELAQLIVGAIGSIEQVRFVNSGTEAAMSAIRLARGYTGRNDIIKFEGAYHGHADYLLVKAGSGSATFGVPDSLGVPEDFARHTINASFNDIKSVERVVRKHKNTLAAIIVEPVLGNCGVIPPMPGFLKGLRALADKSGALLIFDEVITGFRFLYGGAQERFGVAPDLTCLGKIIGGGLPVGAFGGKRKIMKMLAPSGGVYQAGTFSGNPIAVTAGITTLKALGKRDLYKRLEENCKFLCEGIKAIAKKRKIGLKVNYEGPMFSLTFSNKDVVDYRAARMHDAKAFKRLYRALLGEGIYLSPSSLESNFLSTEHTRMDLEKTLSAIDKALLNT